MIKPQVKDIINTCEFSETTVATSLSESGWLKVLSGSALKLYLYYVDLHSKGLTLSSNRSILKKDLNFERNTASSAPKELEAFGFIRCCHCSGNGSKIYDLNPKIYKLPTHWLAILQKNKYKNFIIGILLNTVSQEDLETMGALCVDSGDELLIKTLYPLILKVYDEFSIDMEFVLKDEYTMEDFGLDGMIGNVVTDSDLAFLESYDENEIINSEQLGYYQNINEDKSWQDVLSKEDLKHKYLSGLVEHYYVLFGMPTQKDIEDIKTAYELCFPHQIKRALVKIQASPQYQGKVNNFRFILSLLQKGMFGTRSVKKKDNGGFKKESNRRVIGFKECNVSGTDIKKAFESQMGTDEIVDFDKIFRRNQQ